MYNSGIRGRRSKDGEGITSPQVKYVQTSYPQPSITGYSISGFDDTALDPAGGQTVIINGSGFATGVSATLGGTQIGAVSLVSPTQLSFTAPAKSAGTYALVVYNSTGGAAILAPGVTYSSFPTFTTAAGSIGSVYETTPINSSIVATSDSSITYSLVSGSLPSGASLASNGVITGTAPVDSGSTTYTFSIKATDAELQDVTRTFTLTVNTDVVTWVAPSNNATIQLSDAPYSQVLSATDAAGYGVSYTANTLPTGISLSSGTLSGTASVEGTTTTLLTATAATTNRTSTNTITWTVTLNEQYWKYMPLLLSADGTSQTSSFIADNSNNNSQLTVVGDTRAQNLNPYQFGYYSAYFNANGQYLTGSHPWLNITSTTVAWTFECWVYAVANGGYFFAIGSGSPYGNSLVVTFGAQTANKFSFLQGNGSSANSVSVTSANTYTLNTWYHYAVSRTAAGVMTQYINGVADGTVTYNNATVSAGTTFVVNCVYDNNGLGNNGGNYYISNLRFLINQAAYTANFTPSTAPLQPTQNTLLMLCQSNRFNETSQWGHSVTVGSTPTISQNNPFASQYKPSIASFSNSYYFNGSSYLTIPSSANLLMGFTWTVEMWIYPTASTKQQLFYVGGTYCYIETVSGGINLSKWSNGSNGSNYGGYVVQNAWNHVAWQCDVDGIVRGFINGIVALNSSGYAVNTQTAATIGVAAAANYYTGYISNLRVVVGTALYATAGFTPPNAPLTAITGTQLLTCQGSTLVDSSSNAFTLTPTGTVSVVPFYPAIYTGASATTIPSTYGSGYFNGTTGYVTSSNYGVLFGASDFTIEFWVYLISAATSAAFVGVWTGTASTSAWLVTVGSADATKLRVGTSDGTTATFVESTTGAVPLNTWTHIAITRTGGTLRMFSNGIQVYSAANSTTLASPTTLLQIDGVSGAANMLQTYITDLRIVKGTALYTANFVPGLVTPLTSVANTQLLTLQTNQSHNNTVHKDNSRLTTLVTRNGNTTNGTFSPYGDNWSNYFDGNGDYMTMTYVSDIGNVVLASNSCVEMWIYPTAFTQTASGWPYLVCNGSYNLDDAGWVFGTINGGYVAIKYGTSLKYIKTSTGTVPLNQWSHIAVTIGGGAITFYINGVQSGTFTIDYNGGTYFVNSAVPITIGAHQSVYYTGYMSNLRISYGSSIYTTAFTPSTSLLQPSVYTRLLTAQSNRLIDNSYYNYALTKAGDTAAVKFSPFSTVPVPRYYSTSFNGTSDYLTVSEPIGITGDLTMEMWLFFTASASLQIPFNNTTNGAGAIAFEIQTSAKMGIYLHSFSSPAFTSATALTLSAWNHVALVRSSGIFYIYINGTRDANTYTNSASLGQGGTYYIGRYSAAGEFYSGNISNLRVVHGTAVYTGATITVPTSPLTAITGTQLLTCQDNIIRDNSTIARTITAGTITVKPLLVSPFTPTANALTPYSASTFGGSMYLDGNGDNLAITSPTSYTVPASGSFTAECWVYTLSATQQTIFNINDTGSSGYGAIRPQILAALTIQWLLGPAGSWGVNVTSGSINVGTWNHIAITRNVNSVYFFINGVQTGGTQTYSSALASGGTTYIGTNTGTAYQLNGYVSDFRFFNGVALYTSNFYPGSSPVTPTQTIGASTYGSVLSLNGTSGSVVDQSRTVDLETVGDAKVTPFSPYNGSFYSILHAGSSTNYINTAANAAFNMGTSDFSIEFWVKPLSQAAYSALLSFDSTGDYPICFYWGSSVNSGNIVAAAGTTAAWFATTSAMTFGTTVVGQWTHILLTRSGNDWRTFQDGVLRFYTNQTGTVGDSADGVYIGNQGTSATYMSSQYMSNVRIIKGSIPTSYQTTSTTTGTTIFTPSTSPLTTTSQGAVAANVSLLTCQSNKFVDNSLNNFTLTAGTTPKVQTQNPFQLNSGQSYYFDGTGDYLNCAANLASYTFGTGDFTVECWVYVNTLGSYCILDLRGATSNVAPDFELNSSGQLFVFKEGASTLVTSATAIKAGAWNHVAWVRASGTIKLFVNGVLDANSVADSTSWVGPSTKFTVGANKDAGGLLNGYIADLRVTRGYARYTATFIPTVIPMKLK